MTVPPKYSPLIAALLPASTQKKLVTVEGASHDLPVSHPKDLNDELLAFFEAIWIFLCSYVLMDRISSLYVGLVFLRQTNKYSTFFRFITLPLPSLPYASITYSILLSSPTCRHTPYAPSFCAIRATDYFVLFLLYPSCFFLGCDCWRYYMACYAHLNNSQSQNSSLWYLSIGKQMDKRYSVSSGYHQCH